jgi:hypothetical protein
MGRLQEARASFEQAVTLAEATGDSNLDVFRRHLEAAEEATKHQ